MRRIGGPMAFIREKQGKTGRRYFYLVESARKGGKVRQKVVAYLGQYSTVEAALAGLPRDVDKWRGWVVRARANMAKIRERLRWLPMSCEVPRPRRRGGRGANRLYGKYWFWAEAIPAYERRAEALAARLDQLRSYCSAHNYLADEKIMGTTGDEPRPDPARIAEALALHERIVALARYL